MNRLRRAWVAVRLLWRGWRWDSRAGCWHKRVRLTTWQAVAEAARRYMHTVNSRSWCGAPPCGLMVVGVAGTSRRDLEVEVTYQLRVAPPCVAGLQMYTEADYKDLP